jgi:predicted RND superfamily exporter protein
VTTARLLSALTSRATRRPWLTVALAVVLGLGGVAFALRLRPSAGTDTLVSSSSSEYKETQRYYKNFGEEPIVVLVKGSLQQLVLSSDIDRLVGLEGCLSGNVPVAALPREGGLNGPCGQLAKARTVKLVFGPGTFINEAATQIDEQLALQTKQAEVQAKQAQRVVTQAALQRGLTVAEAQALGRQASKITTARFQESLATLALQYGLTAQPSLNDPSFVSTLVFDSSKGAGTPKQRFAYLFPSSDSALVAVRMKAGLSERARTRTIALIRAAVAMKQWRLQHGESYLVTGEPVIVADLNNAIGHAIELLLVAVLLVMAGALGLVFSGRPRLLPLAVALLAAALTFGALSIVGASLTMASIAVLPVLVGLAVDYAIQFQSRVHEASEEAEGGENGGAEDVHAAVRHAAAFGAPTIATAGAASAAAMLVLALSPVPMVRGFGLLLVAGVVIAFACVLTAGAAMLVLRTPIKKSGTPDASLSTALDRHVTARTCHQHALHRPVTPSLAQKRPAAPLFLIGVLGERVGASGTDRAGVAIGSAAALWLGTAWRGARELLRENPVTRFVARAALIDAVRRPERLLGVGLALALLGWGLGTQTQVQTDITKLVPQSLGSLQGLNTLEQVTGVGGEIDLMVSAKDLTKPATIEWMSRYESAVLSRFGYSEAGGCRKARLCPAFSLPDLFHVQAAATSAAPKLKQAEVSGLLRAIPPYFSQDVIAPDRRVATLAFGIRLMSLERQQQLIEEMRASLHPPPGVSAQLVGLGVLATRSGTEVASPWRRIESLIAGLAAVALVLLIAFRGDRRRALVPLVPIVLATGWSELILFAVRVPLNPMSITLGALVIAISTEFSVLLSERHRQERLAGYDTVEALRRSYRRTGAAVAASGVTAIAGFGVLALSDIAMLRDFGVVTLIDLSASLVGVLVALPAALTIAERGDEPARLLPVLGRALAAIRLGGRGRTRHEPV